MNTRKYIIIAGATLVFLIVVYVTFLFTKQSNLPPNDANTPMGFPTVSQNILNIPTSTPAPLNPLPENIDPSVATNYSPIDQAFLDQMKRDEITQRPDVTVSNATPYNNESFLATTEFVEAQPAGYFKLVIYPSSDDEVRVNEEVEKWLKSLGLPEESISRLVIERQSIARPIPEN